MTLYLIRGIGNWMWRRSKKRCWNSEANNSEFYLHVLKAAVITISMRIVSIWNHFDFLIPFVFHICVCSSNTFLFLKNNSLSDIWSIDIHTGSDIIEFEAVFQTEHINPCTPNHRSIQTFTYIWNEFAWCNIQHLIQLLLCRGIFMVMVSLW